jgi:hypothetical protein
MTELFGGGIMISQFAVLNNIPRRLQMKEKFTMIPPPLLNGIISAKKQRTQREKMGWLHVVESHARSRHLVPGRT